MHRVTKAFTDTGPRCRLPPACPRDHWAVTWLGRSEAACEATFTGANLIRATLTGAHLIQADLDGTFLSRATLTGANLWNATLADANLEGATLTDARLEAAKLTGAVGLTAEQISEARTDAGTRLPPHLVRMASE
ncbi:pentapeptide repeat-containing protein [Streptomyces sp. MS1.AVA.4]|uniref:Pentapeptide repeat-containing protein n=1 Tax=Streptomyces pratisoli TaxID=3139917 RepID=A0ACC6QUR8_9ACTN